MTLYMFVSDINECDSNPWIHGECLDGDNKLEHCSVVSDIDECASNPCVNGACTDGVNSWVCSCD